MHQAEKIVLETVAVAMERAIKALAMKCRKADSFAKACRHENIWVSDAVFAVNEKDAALQKSHQMCSDCHILLLVSCMYYFCTLPPSDSERTPHTGGRLVTPQLTQGI